MKHQLILTIIFNIVVVILGSPPYESTLTEPDTSNWDILIFTQHWPNTVCYEWMSKSKTNRCTFPKFKGIWTIHGVWPTKLGTLGPSLCNKTWHFDPAKLEPLLDDLDTFWLNIETNTPKDSFWKHEWEKHGTCAAELPELDSEDKYFGKGLSWLYKYEMESILRKNNIVPTDARTYTVEEFHTAIKSETNTNVGIECVKNKHDNITLISEIRVCFNKQLELIDCNGIRGENYIDHPEIITNCKLNAPIVYSGQLPYAPTTPRFFFKDVVEGEYDDDEVYMMRDESPGERAKRAALVESALEWYKIFNFLRWMTL